MFFAYKFGWRLSLALLQGGVQSRFMSLHAATNLLVAVACGAVAVVLFLGLGNMWRGGDPNLSQRLMRWRIGLQFVAIVIIMGVLFFRPHR